MNSNNKKRLLALIDILKTKTDFNHSLSLNEIVDLLQAQGIIVNNRKTLYDDFKILNEYNYVIEYSNGYYLSEAPFSLSEIKIIIDSINSLKNLDDNVLKTLTDKLYSFVSNYEKDLLNKLEYHNKHKDKKFINRLEDTLEAIRLNTLISIKRSSKDDEIIAPLFLYRSNDYYYLYYHYENNNKIYHVRFDNIQSIKLLKQKDTVTISKQTIIDYITESTNSFYSNKAQIVTFEILQNSEYLRNRISDDFSNVVFTKNGFSIKTSLNNMFYSKIAAYGTQIKISDKQIANLYKDYLESIINIHTKQ